MATAPKRKRAPLICQSCDEPENFDDMVNCGKCRKWSHFYCAGVGPKIKDDDWNCNRCKGKQELQKNLSCLFGFLDSTLQFSFENVATHKLSFTRN